MPDTIEVIEEAAPAIKAVPTHDELKSQGWSAAELEKAEKRGMLTKPEEKKLEDIKTPESKSPAIPDFNLTAEQEKVFLTTFGPGSNARGLYFRMKNERQGRQALEAKLKEMSIKLETLTAKPQETIVHKDAEGNIIDPEEQPLTLKALKQMQTKDAEELAKLRSHQQEKQQGLAAAQTQQEEYVRSTHEDFDKTVDLAKEVMQNLETLVPEKWKQTKAVKLIRDLQVAAAHADQIGLDEYNAAHIAYELGQLHPKYGQKADEEKKTGADKTPEKDPKANGGLTAEQMKRIEANTNKRGASAAVPAGGGKRTISVDDVDLNVLNGMTFLQRETFKKKYPEKYGSLLRG